MTEIGYILEELRANCESQNQQANKLGVNCGLLSKLNNGERSVTIDFVEKLDNKYFLTKNMVEKLKEILIDDDCLIRYNETFGESASIDRLLYILYGKKSFFLIYRDKNNNFNPKNEYRERL